MSERILVPVLGESVTEATVAKWLKNEGDKVNIDEAIVELETDKVNIEVPSPSNGTVEKISVKEGQTVNVGVLLGTITQSKNSIINKIEEEKKYSPPQKKLHPAKEKKEISKTEVKQKIELSKKESEEEPLILTEIHKERKEKHRTSQRRQNKRKT